MKRRREAEVLDAFAALQRQVDLCTTIMRRDGIGAHDFDNETTGRLQALGKRFAALRQAFDRDYPTAAD